MRNDKTLWTILTATLAALVLVGCPSGDPAVPDGASADGAASPPSAVEAPGETAAPPIDTAAIDLISRGEDSYQMILGGNPLGVSRSSARVEDGLLIFQESASVPDAQFLQELIGQVDAETLAMRAFGARGQMGAPVDVAITWEGDKIQGYSDFPRAPGLPQGRVELGTELAPGTFERLSLFYLIPGMPLEEGAQWALKVFNPFDLRVRTRRLRVAGREEMTVPAGTFDTFRVELDGGEPSQIFWITTAPPRRTVRIQLIGQPWVYELLPEGAAPPPPSEG